MITPNFYMAITKKHQGADSAPQKTERTSNDGQLFAAFVIKYISDAGISNGSKLIEFVNNIFQN